MGNSSYLMEFPQNSDVFFLPTRGVQATELVRSREATLYSPKRYQVLAAQSVMFLLSDTNTGK